VDTPRTVNNCDTRCYVDISPDRVRVRTDVVGAFDQRLRRLLVDTRERHGKRGGQHEGPRGVSAETDFGDDFDILLAKPEPSLSTYTQQRVLEARRIATCEELLGVGRTALAAEGLRQCQVEFEKSVVAADRSMATACRRDFRRLQNAHDGCSFCDGHRLAVDEVELVRVAYLWPWLATVDPSD
jgi:hypothetical protein